VLPLTFFEPSINIRLSSKESGLYLALREEFVTLMEVFLAILVLAAIGLFFRYWFITVPLLILVAMFFKFTTVGKNILKKQEEQRLAKEQEDQKKKENDERLAQQAEDTRRSFRDADQQDKPYRYEIGRHANETLALRYGIANLNGVDGRGHPAKFIDLRKLERVGSNVYLVEISGFRKRKAKAVIEVGTEYVKTFLPLSEDWFSKYANLEETLKGNKTMSLKDIARFHVEKVVN